MNRTTQSLLNVVLAVILGFLSGAYYAWAIPRYDTVTLMMLLVGVLLVGVLIGAMTAGLAMLLRVGLSDRMLGTEVQTTDEYLSLFNDSFRGRVIRGEHWGDHELTIRLSEGVQRRINTKWIRTVDWR